MTESTAPLWVPRPRSSVVASVTMDFIVVEADGTHWVVEVKMDKEMESEDVLGKREAALRWANYVTADEQVGAVWRYLLVSETDVEIATRSWGSLKKLGGE